MIILHKKKLIFIHVHRTAGTSFSEILRQNFDKKSKTNHSNSKNDFEDLNQHSNARTLSKDFFDQHKDYYIFGFTRNPWERIFSWYSLIQLNNLNSLAEEKIRFEKFIELNQASDFSSHFFHYNSLDYFTTEDGELIANKIFRYENLNDEIKTIAHQFDLTLSEIPHVNVTKTNSYKEYYTDKSRDLIAEKCKKDIEYFNYTF